MDGQIHKMVNSQIWPDFGRLLKIQRFPSNSEANVYTVHAVCIPNHNLKNFPLRFKGQLIQQCRNSNVTSRFFSRLNQKMNSFDLPLSFRLTSADFLTPLGTRTYRFEQKQCPNRLCVKSYPGVMPKYKYNYRLTILGHAVGARCLGQMHIYSNSHYT